MNDLLPHLTVDPQVGHGKLVVRGLRYPVEMLLELMISGMTYEDLEREDLLATRLYRRAS